MINTHALEPSLNQTSIVTITFNNQDELVQTCESIAPLRGLVEHVVINGGSDVSSKNFLSQQLGIISISEKDNGIADAFNKGFRKSTGKYLMYVNSGDLLVNSQYVLSAQKVFESMPDVGFVYGNLSFQHPQAGLLIYTFKAFKHLSAGQPYFFPTMIFRKSVLDQIGIFNLNYKIGMDFDLIVRLEKNKIKGHYLDTAPVVLMDGNGISSLQEYKSILENERSLKENKIYNRHDLYNLSKRKMVLLVKKILFSINLEKMIFKYKQLKYSKGIK